MTFLRSQTSRLRYYWRAWLKHREIDRRGTAQVEADVNALRVLRGELEPGRKLLGIFLAEHAGDIVAAEPIIGALRQKHPDAYIVWATREPFRELVCHHPDVDQVLVVRSIRDTERLMRSGVFSISVDLQIEGKLCSQLRRVHARTDGDRCVTIDNYYEHGSLLEVFARSAGLPSLRAGPRLYLPSETRTRIDHLSLPCEYVVIHARSNEDLRNWEEAKWEALVAHLAGRGFPVVEVGLDPVLGAQTPGVMGLCGKLSLLETAEVIRRATLFVGIDSAPAHIANAFVCPSVILLGSYKRFARYMPFSGHLSERAREMVIQWPAPCREIPVSEVIARVDALLGHTSGGTRP